MEFLAAAGVASVQVAGVEADDLIAGLADLAAAAGWEVVIASSDKDFMQLVSEERQNAECKMQNEDVGESVSSFFIQPSAFPRGRIGLVNPGDKSERVWGAAEVWAKVGVRPSQVVDWLALVGDAVDNIPGVPGVGAKTAAMLLGRFGSVAGIYARLAEVESERLQKALAESAEVVRRNVELVRLRRVVPEGVVSVEGLRGREPDWERLTGLFRGWGFRGMLAQAEAASARMGAGSGGRGVRRVEPGRDLVERQALLL
jgi:DNA polymerase-1